MSSRKRKLVDLPLKIRLLLATHSVAVHSACRSDHTINRSVLNVFDRRVPPSRIRQNGVITWDTIVDESRDLWFRLYNPSAAAASMPVIIYFHGGGFATMAPSSKPYDVLCRRLAREIPAVVISVNYRLAPEHKYPSQYEDGFDALKFIDDKTRFDGLPTYANLKHCFLAGDSAGGNLAHHVILKSREFEFCNLKFSGFVSIQPFFGGEERTESELLLTEAPIVKIKHTDWMWKAFLPEGSDRDHPVVNVFGPKSVDISGVQFPATLVVVGGFDPLQDWQRRYLDGLQKSGKEVYMVEYPNAFHGFYGFPELPEFPLFIRDVKYFVQNRIG